jgi:hypothetical protein
LTIKFTQHTGRLRRQLSAISRQLSAKPKSRRAEQTSCRHANSSPACRAPVGIRHS